MKEKLDYIEIRYNFGSLTGVSDANRYITDYSVYIYGHGVDDKGLDNRFLVGEAELKHILLGLAVEHDIKFSNIFEREPELTELGHELFKSGKRRYKKTIEDFLVDSFNPNILFLKRIEVLPEYRGDGIGKKVIKDIIYRMSDSFGLMVLKVPSTINEETDTEKDVEAIEDNIKTKEEEMFEKLVQKNLMEFYRSLGFININGDEYFFYNPVFENPQLDKIDIAT